MTKTKVLNINKEEKTNNSHSTDVHMSLAPNNPPKLTSSQRAQLDALRNLSDNAVRKEAEEDPDCEPL